MTRYLAKKASDFNEGRERVNFNDEPKQLEAGITPEFREKIKSAVHKTTAFLLNRHN